MFSCCRVVAVIFDLYYTIQVRDIDFDMNLYIRSITSLVFPPSVEALSTSHAKQSKLDCYPPLEENDKVINST